MKKAIGKRTIQKTAGHSSLLIECRYVRDYTADVRDLFERHFAIVFQKNEKSIEIKSKQQRVPVHFENIFLASKGNVQEIVGPRQNLFCLFLTDQAFQEAIAENKLSHKNKITLLNLGQTFKPTFWLKAALNQYFYETIIMLDSPPGCTFFLEKQIINEVMRCLFSNYYLKNENSKHLSVDIETFEIVKYIESRLYEESLTIPKIARDSGLSESSLLRKFKNSFGYSPQSYIRNRRLEDAFRFIKQEKMSVTEACFQVGYSDFASFSRSFKNKFGVPPSRLGS